MNWYLIAGLPGSPKRIAIAGPLASREAVDALVPGADRVLMGQGVQEAFFAQVLYETALLDHQAPGKFNGAFGVTT